jgi:glycosyltransferase involved in cell wall biosynthesis
MFLDVADRCAGHRSLLAGQAERELMSIQVSVVVPTCKRPQLLAKCLNALVGQDFPGGAYEIIVVDDGGCYESRALVERFSGRTGPAPGAFPEILYVPTVHTKGPATARNIGWRAARGEMIAFTDDDCLPEPDWLKEGVKALQNGFDGVSGRVIVPLSHEPTDYQKSVSQLMNSEFVTANCFYRLRVLALSGGFDERFSMAWREDSELFFRMLELSCKLGSAPAARVVHPARPAPWGVSIKEQRKSMFNALLYKKYPDLYRRRLQEFPPLRYYAIVFCILVFFGAILMNNGPAAFLAALAWLALTLQFALQRLQHTAHTPSHIFEMPFTSMLIPPLSVFWRLFGAFYYQVLFF